MTGSPSAGSSFGRLRVKLFLAIAGANALLAAVAYLVFRASLDRGLAETLGRGDQARLEAFAASLAEGYGRERGWGWLADDRDRWTELSREALGLPRRPPGEGTQTGGTAQPAGSPRELPLTVSSRLLLFDAERKPLAGPPELAERAS
jgi:two-component system sensor histidine kinase BaeS